MGICPLKCRDSSAPGVGLAVFLGGVVVLLRGLGAGLGRHRDGLLDAAGGRVPGRGEDLGRALALARCGDQTGLGIITSPGVQPCRSGIRAACQALALAEARRIVPAPPIRARRHGATPSISVSSEKLRNVLITTISPSTRTLSRVGETATVRTRSAATRTSSPRQRRKLETVRITNSPAALRREIAKAGEHPRMVALPPTWWTSSPPASGSPSRT